MKKIGYIRVSTQDQNVGRQIEGLRPLCDEMHIETLSAVARSRPVYDAVVARLQRNDKMVVWALDRAFRSTKEALAELEALQARGVYFQIANFNLDTTTPHGKFIYTIMSGAAQYEREILIERTKEGIAVARAQGKLIGRPPKMSEKQLTEARRKLLEGSATKAAIAAEHGVSPWTLTRALKRTMETKEG